MTVPLVANHSVIASGASPLEAIASVRERLIDASVGLRRHSRVKHVKTDVDLREYRTGSALETFVEAELDTGSTLTWWIEISWQEVWKIVARVYRDSEDGQVTLIEFHERASPEPSGFVQQINQVGREVVASIEHVESFL
jgi:hypothetical protein